MNRASPVEMRKALEVVAQMKAAGILFVAIPVVNESQHEQLKKMLNDALEEIARQCEEK